jgi:molybdate/tungstate transport system substrate-binding protein
MKRILLLSLILAIIAGGAACGAREKTPLRVLFAGSLIVPLAEVEREFERAHPDIDVQLEGHGSIQVVRHVAELGDEADALAVADYSLIPLLMYQTKMPGSDRPYADWTIQFATNRLGIAYTPHSRYAGEINTENWYEVLTRPDTLVGLSDPRFDACGYRALMATQLAEAYYGDNTIFEQLLGNRFTLPVAVRETDGVYTIMVPEIMETPRDSTLVLRGYSVQLLALLESGDLDYAFEYESVARQHGLQFVSLPPEIDMGSTDYQDIYARVLVELASQRFATVAPRFQGEPIIYGVTIPANAPHPDQAAEFVAFLVGPEGQAIMARNEHPPIVPPVADNKAALPEMLQALVK